MKLGPHPDNLKGELALEQLHYIKDAVWPGLQGDIDRNHVVELASVDIVPCKPPLTDAGPLLGIKVPGADRPVPISPGLSPFRGRHRAWVLPTTGIAVAVEPLDDEESYLRQHRRDLFAAQDVQESDLVPLGDLRRGDRSEFGTTPAELLYALGAWLWNRRVRAYFEAPFEKRRAKVDATDPFVTSGFSVYSLLVVGHTYRVRPTKQWRRIIEPIGGEDDAQGAGPYR